jgi:lysophospholipase L1-like esterase
VVVTYTHHDAWKGPVPAYKADLLPRTAAALKSRAPLRIVAYGMSITRGLDVSGYDTVPPYMPTYVDLFARSLRQAYHDEGVRLFNAGLPGSVVDWGAAYADSYVSPLRPDLVILDFGMNDFWRYTPAQFGPYIDTIMAKVRKTNPAVEFILLSNMRFDPAYLKNSDGRAAWYTANLLGYADELRRREGPGVANLDMTTLSGYIYSIKRPKDCIANPLHPNDYLARWYAQGLGALLIR